MKYSEIIGVEKHFKSAFDITSDTGDAWKTFISNERFENNLNQIIVLIKNLIIDIYEILVIIRLWNVIHFIQPK